MNMNEETFVESIKLQDGILYNLPLHQERMYNTIKEVFKKDNQINLASIEIPENVKQGLFKCRVIYNQELLSIEYQPYILKNVNSISLVYDDEISYTFKSLNKDHINRLVEKNKAEEILIVKNGYITDTSRSNVVFEDETGFYTPTTYLLKGTKREMLLNSNRIKERKIRVEDIKHYKTMYLINAMIDIEDNVKIDTDKIT